MCFKRWECVYRYLLLHQIRKMQVVKHFWISKHDMIIKLAIELGCIIWISGVHCVWNLALSLACSNAVSRCVDTKNYVKKWLDRHNYKDFILHSLVALGSLPKRDNILHGLVTLAREPRNKARMLIKEQSSKTAMTT